MESKIPAFGPPKYLLFHQRQPVIPVLGNLSRDSFEPIVYIYFPIKRKTNVSILIILFFLFPLLFFFNVSRDHSISCYRYAPLLSCMIFYHVNVRYLNKNFWKTFNFFPVFPMVKHDPINYCSYIFKHICKFIHNFHITGWNGPKKPAKLSKWFFYPFMTISAFIFLTDTEMLLHRYTIVLATHQNLLMSVYFITSMP